MSTMRIGRVNRDYYDIIMYKNMNIIFRDSKESNTLSPSSIIVFTVYIQL